jgi:hypothetical protein
VFLAHNQKKDSWGLEGSLLLWELLVQEIVMRLLEEPAASFFREDERNRESTFF